MSSPKLTVVIPTYNRAKPLRETLARLKSQLNERWRLIILDNHSDEPMQLIAEQTGLLSSPNVSVIRNPVNIGLAGNILRAFEVAETEWLVILGDDDEVSHTYVETILANITRFPKATFMNFASSIFPRPTHFETDGLEAFITRMDNWSNVLFVSCSAFNREHLLRHLRFGYIYAYTMAPHIAIVLRCLREEGGSVIFSTENIIRYKDSESVSWPRVFLSNVVLLLELLPTNELQRTLFEKMEVYFIPLKESADHFLRLKAQTQQEYGFHFYLRRCFANAFRRWTQRNLRAVVLEYLVRFPRLGAKVLRAGLFGKKTPSAGECSRADLEAGL